MNKLDRWLFNRNPFPKCQMANTSGLGVRQGVERYVACSEAYGPGFKLATIEQCLENCEPIQICRKHEGYRQYEHSNPETGQHQIKTVPIYIDRPRPKRSKPHYVEVHMDGQPTTQRHYYKIKRKKKRMF